mgnify:CR=1 FL=1
MILFYDIFERAFNLFDDPDISKKYYNDQAGFQKDMLDYLMIGKNKFTSPVSITDKLLVCEKPIGKQESDSGDGSATYVLEQQVPHGGEGVGFTFRIGPDRVLGEYDPETNSVTFPREVNINETWSVTWFYAGAFTADFSGCLRSDFPMDAIMDKVITILAYGLLSAWGDKEVGRVLEVRNILTDTDFKMYSPANSARAKVEWRDQMNRDMDTLVSELNWRIMSTPKGGTRFGK